jgi:YHS domain-containing protein
MLPATAKVAGSLPGFLLRIYLGHVRFALFVRLIHFVNPTRITMTFVHTTIKLAAAASLLLASAAALAINPYFTTEEGAIKGYDPVAYFSEHKAIKGDKQFSYTWQKSEWHFASEANLNAFKADPEKFAPQFGGYCAYGVAKGHAPPIDPTAYSIIDGRLYLNYNKNVSERWEKDVPGYLSEANKNWPGLKAGDKVDD